MQKLQNTRGALGQLEPAADMLSSSAAVNEDTTQMATTRGNVLPAERQRVSPADLVERRSDSVTPAWRALKLALLVWLCVRLVLSAWGALVFLAENPQSFENARQTYVDVAFPNHNNPTAYDLTIGLWNIYDTHHYITIAEHGYAENPTWLTAYFPGLPFLIKVVSVATMGNSLLAGWLIANIAAVVFLMFMYRLADREYGAAVARRTVVLAAIFPSAFFLYLGYVESLFLACAVAAFYYGAERKWWLAGGLGACAALAKQPGVFLVVPLAYMYAEQTALLGEWRQPRIIVAALLRRLEWLWLALIPAAAGAYMLYRYLFIGTPLDRVNDLGGQEELNLPGVAFLRAIGQINSSNPVVGFNLMDIGFTLLMIALVVGVLLKVRSVPMRVYSVLLLIANLCLTFYSYPVRPEVNMPRRMLLIFPIFIFLGLALENKRAFRYTFAVSFLAFMLLSGLFVDWNFVS